MHKRNIKINFLLFCASALTIILIGEVILRIYFHASGQVIGVDEEEKCKRMTFRVLSNKNQTYRFNPGNTDYLEYYNYTGVRPKANVSFTVNGYLPNGSLFVAYTQKTNNQHMRGFKDFNYTKYPNKIRIAVFGDSFTWGADTYAKFSYPSTLQDLIPNSEVLNFGVEGSGIDIMYLRWKYEALQFKPDVVIFSIYIDDIRRASPCVYKPKIQVANDKLSVVNLPPQELRNFYETYKEPKFESYLAKDLLYALDNFEGVTKKQYDHGFRILSPILDEIKSRSKDDNTYFMVLIISVGNNYKNTKVELDSIKKIKKILEQKQIAYITSDEIFNKEKYLAIDYTNKTGHFFPDGYAYIAQGIKNQLEKDRIVEKSPDYNFRWLTDESPPSHLLRQNKNNSSDERISFVFDVSP